MWKESRTTNILTLFVVTLAFTAQLSGTVLALSDKRLCADENCKEIISLGTGIINYRAGEKGMVSFKINAPIRIKSKAAGKDTSLWGIEVNGREGYAPKQFIRETKIYISEKNLKFVVDVVEPGLEISENVKQKNIVDATTTKPPKMTSEESTEKTPDENPNEKLSVESPAVASPVLFEVVDGTNIPIINDKAHGAVERVMEHNGQSKYETEFSTDEEGEIGDYDENEKNELLYSQQTLSEGNSKTVSTPERDSQKPSETLRANNNDVTPKALNIKAELNLPALEKGHEDDIILNKSKHYIKDLDDMNNSEVSNTFEDLNNTNFLNEGNIFLRDIQKNVAQKSELNNEVSSSSETKESVISTKNSISSVAKEEEVIPKKTENERIKKDILPDVGAADELNMAEVLIPSESHQNSQEFTENIPDKIGLFKSSEIKKTKENLSDKYQESNGKNGNHQKEILGKLSQKEQSKMNNPAKIITIKTQSNTEVKNNLQSDRELPFYTNSVLQSEIKSPTYSGKMLQNSQYQEKVEGNIQNVRLENLQKDIKLLSSIPKNRIEQQTDIPSPYNLYDDAPSNTPLPSQYDYSNQDTVSSSTVIPQNEYHVPQSTDIDSDLKNSVIADNLKHATVNNDKLNDTSKEISKEDDPKQVIQDTMNILDDNIKNNNVKENLNDVDNQKTFITNMLLDIKSSEIKETTEISSDKYQENISGQNGNYQKEILGELSQKKQGEMDNPVEMITIKTQSNTEVKNNLQSDREIQFHTKSVLQSERKSPAYSGKMLQNSEDHQKVEGNIQNVRLENLQKDTKNKKEQQTDIPSPYNPYDGAPSNTPLPPQYDYSNQDTVSSSTEIPQNKYVPQSTDDSSDLKNAVIVDNLRQNVDPLVDHATVNNDKTETLQTVDSQPKALPSLIPPFNDQEVKENKGLFGTIISTVNNMLSLNKKNNDIKADEEDELHRILFSKNDGERKVKTGNKESMQYCEQIGPNGNCPQIKENHKVEQEYYNSPFTKLNINADLTFDAFLKSLASKILEMSKLLAFLAVTSISSLFFIFGYYCFCNSSREGALLSKLNQLESSLLAMHKENNILKHNLMSTRQKLASIEDNSFGSNDMVVSLRKELEDELLEKARLQEQINTLQKELENAVDAGIELNKIVSELLSNQTGDESIISSVEELQKQLNEQQNTILEINASLAEKSRENSELQLLIAEQAARYESELASMQRDNDELEQEKVSLVSRLEEMKNDFDKDITAALEGKNLEIKRLQNDIAELNKRFENEHTKWQTSVAKAEALEECLRNVRKDPNVNITEVIDVANIKAQLIEAQEKYKTLKEKLEVELYAKKVAENQLQIITAEVEKLKQDFNQSEKDKLEAQTRLEVLSNYFKEKESQLQKELSLKEAMWLKQQGETTTTVDRLTAMQEEIQFLKSQNDSLRAEIEAQVAAHKAQTGTLENRAHETWLAARQSDRRYEEARAEATALRRKLTALAGGNISETKPSAGPAGLKDELTSAPSPIHMESPGSPMLGRMPPPPFLPPPFMGPPPPFMNIPPPPSFPPPGEMRPAPLGRIMSPLPQRSGRFSPQHLDFEDYLDYEDNITWHRHTYSPPPRTYRSLSPTDSRYNYGTERDLMSTYDTETDFSPPPSPRNSRRLGAHTSERGGNNARSLYNNKKNYNSGTKGPLSSGSEKSYKSPSHNTKPKSNTTGSVKTLV